LSYHRYFKINFEKFSASNSIRARIGQHIFKLAEGTEGSANNVDFPQCLLQNKTKGLQTPLCRIRETGRPVLLQFLPHSGLQTQHRPIVGRSACFRVSKVRKGTIEFHKGAISSMAKHFLQYRPLQSWLFESYLPGFCQNIKNIFQKTS